MEIAMKRVICAVVGLGFAWLVGCERPAANAGSSAAAKQPSGGTTSVALPVGLFVKTEPADVKDVVDAKRDAKGGDTIVIRGRVGGSEDPFVAERAIFTIVDKSVPICGE